MHTQELQAQISKLEAENLALQEERDTWKDAAINGGNAAYLRERIATLEAQLAGGEAVAELWSGLNDCARELGYDFLRPEFAHASRALVKYAPNNLGVHTAAPAIKQQGAEEAPTVAWLIEDYDCYGKPKFSVVLSPLTDDTYLPDTAEAHALCKKDSTPTQPVSANQPDSGKDDPFLLKSMGVGAEGDEQ